MTKIILWILSISSFVVGVVVGAQLLHLAVFAICTSLTSATLLWDDRKRETP